jgi:2-aminoethylphosphonate dioxygenase
VDPVCGGQSPGFARLAARRSDRWSGLNVLLIINWLSDKYYVNTEARAVAAESAPLPALDVAAFRRQRYLVVPGLFGPEETREIRRWVDEVQAWPETAGRHMMYFEQTADGRRLLNRMENVPPYHAGFDRLARGERLLGACAQLFGEPAVLFKDKINFKLPGGGGFDPHQDVQAGWARYASVHITALIAVDRATIANGCLEVAKDFHRHALIGNEWEPLTEVQLTGIRFVPVEAVPGDTVFFDSFLPHRSAPNHTTEQRRVLYYTYNKASEGDHLQRYYADKRASYPPDIEREAGREYRYRV